MNYSSKKLYQSNKKKKSARIKSLYECKALILLSAILYIVLGAIEKIPFYVFQVLFIIEGLAFFQEAINSAVKKSNIAIGVLCIAWSVVVSLQTALTTGYKFSISNQVIVCNLIYVAILGILIFQIQAKKNMYGSPNWKNLSVVICIISSIIILLLLSLISVLQITEIWDLEITPLLASVLKISTIAWELVLKFPIAEWLLQGSILCSILLQSNKRYIKSDHLKKSVHH